jgi:diphosphomevalonate decarboxylase
MRERTTDANAKVWKVQIVSINNFPTAAGLASSASGYACLTFTLAQLFGVTGNVSDVARMGSGSACRSLYGGFVRWEMGQKEDGTDSLASQVVDEHHWEDMRVIICVVSDKKKTVSSSSGMKTTVETSDLMQHRMTIVPQRMQEMEAAIQAKDFPKFAELTMKDSNSFHSVCLDTYPPISYMNDTSRRIVQLIHQFNADQVKAAYTFDAGPNAVLYVPKEHVESLVTLLEYYFPSSKPSAEFVRGLDKIEKMGTVPQHLQAGSKGMPVRESDGLNYMICTRVGAGPQVITESLVDDKGFPKAK